MTPKDLYARFCEVIQRIPEGRVVTYGQVATLAGLPGYARQVGYALNSFPDEIDLPWHRVINSKGQVSKRADPAFEEIQRRLLEAEGVIFDQQGRIPLAVYRWVPE